MVCQRDDYYEDAHGNKIIGKFQGLKFAFSGFHSCIKIGNNVRFQNTSIYVHNDSKVIIENESCLQNSEILIGNSATVEFDAEVNLNECDVTIGDYSAVLLEDNVRIYGKMFHKTRWIMEENVRLHIGSRSYLFNGYLGMLSNSSLQIGKEFSVGENYHIALDNYTEILIGDDCMFSNDVFLRSNDGHSIFDIATGKNINSTQEIGKKRKIEIGNHVWVGMRAAILYHTKIGDGSIVGALSLVKNVFPNNCILAGTPAKMIKKDISWSREYGAEDIAECGSQYVNLTK